MPFLFTMPISRMIPMMPTAFKILAGNDQCEQRADACRRKSGKNRDWVDEALVQNAENDVDSHQGSKNKQGFVGKRIVERRRRPLKVGLQAGGEVQEFLTAFSMSLIAVPREALGARLNETVTDGNCP